MTIEMTIERILQDIENYRNRLRVVHGIKDPNGYHLQLLHNMDTMAIHLNGNDSNFVLAETKTETEQLIKDFLELRNRVAAGETAPDVVRDYMRSH